MSRSANAQLLAAARAGTLAVILAGASIHVMGVGRAMGNYFKQLSRAELEAAPAEKASFERYLALEWNAAVVAGGSAAGGGMAGGMAGGVAVRQSPGRLNLIFVGS